MFSCLEVMALLGRTWTHARGLWRCTCQIAILVGYNETGEIIEVTGQDL